ncbi:hypothetical protein JCM1841_002728 [Sporobolomyces salmonicolor]
MKFLAPLRLVTVLSGLAAAHPGAHDELPSQAELARRSLRAREASKCSAQLENMKARSKAKRALHKRNIPTSVLSAATAQETAIANQTCILTPTVTEGPYYLNGELLRTSLAEDEPGVPLTLDIGVLDINTCEPLENVMVELWHCNATGSYSFFTTATLDAPGGGSGGGNGTGPGFSGNGTAPGANGYATAASSLTKRSETGTNDDGTFCRGGYSTNDAGLVEFTSVFPGYYTGRTVHIHVMVRKDYEIAENGTIIARSGTVINEGQIFFDEALIAQVLNTSAYLNTTQSRTYNDEDSILASALDSSWNPFVDYELVGDSILDGVFGSITLGVDTNASITIDSTNTLSSLAPTAVASALSAAGLSAYISTATAVVTAAATNVVTSAGSRLKLFF